MTATPPRADLRTLATHAAHDVDCPDGPNCGDELTTDGRYGRYAAAVLAAVLPEHRRMVLGEAVDDLHRVATHLRATNPDSSVAKGVRYAEARIRAQLAAAPPAGLSASVPAGNAPAASEATPDDAPLGSEALALAEHFRSLGCGQVVDPVDLEDCGGMAEEVLRFLTARGWRAPALPEEADGQRRSGCARCDTDQMALPCYCRRECSSDICSAMDQTPAPAPVRQARGDALTYDEMESDRDRLARELYEAHAILGAVVAERDDARDGTRRAWLELEHWRTVIVPELMEQRDRLGTDRDRLAAQVAHYQRVVERVRDLADRMEAEAPKPQVGGFIAEEIRAAVDALPDAGPHQHECACNRNWGGPCGPCVCEEPPRQGVWRLTCGAENIPPNQTYATKGAAEDVMRLHGGACPGTHGVEFVPDAGTNQTEGDHGH